MAITAADVKNLRDQTGAGMMDCKKALSESGGDIQGAIEYLRKKGEKVAAKRSDKETKEGVVIAQVSDDKKRGVIVRLSCETDFVSKGDDFVNFTQKIADLALEKFPADLDSLLALPMGDSTVGQSVTDMVGKINEKIFVSAYEKLEAAQVAPYIHSGYRAGVLVGLSSATDSVHDAGRDVAMQVAAMRPVALDQDSVDQSVIDKEIEIGMDIARQEGKPEEMVEKIAKGKLNKFFKDSTLVNQAYVKDNKQTVAQYLDSQEKGLKATAFRHVELG